MLNGTVERRYLVGAGQPISLSRDTLLRGRADLFTSFAMYSRRPSFIALQDDLDYWRAIADADLAMAASGWAVLFWRLIQREMLTRISGLPLFKTLFETRQARVPQNLFLFCQECSQEFVRLDDVATFSMATAILARDFPVVQAFVAVTALSVVVLNLAVDLVYLYLDPRIRH